MPGTSVPRSLLAVVLAMTMFVGAACSADGSDDAGPSTTAKTDEQTTTSEGDGPSSTTEATGDEAGDRQAYLDAFTKGFQDEEEQVFDSGQVDCLAERYLDTIGLDNLVDAGVTPEEYGDGNDFPEEVGLDEDKANELYDQFGACDIDLKEIFIDVFARFSPEPLTDEQRSCIDDALTEEKLRRSFVADLLDLDEDQDPLDGLDTCVPDSFGDTDSTTDTPTANTIDPGN